MSQSLNPTLESLSGRLSNLVKTSFKKNPNKDIDELYDEARSKIEQLFKDICRAVRTVDSSGLPEFVIEADKMLNELYLFSHGQSSSSKMLYEFMPSCAHDDESGSPLVKDPNTEQLSGMGAGMVEGAIKAFLGPNKNIDDLPEVAGHWSRKSYDPTTKLHERSTPLALFRPNLPPVDLSETPLAGAVYQARCSISNKGVSNPIQLALPPNSSCMGLLTAGGWSGRDPMLMYYNLDDHAQAETSSGQIMPKERSIKLGLKDIAQRLEVDNSQRQLLWAADSDRIKSFAIDFSEERARKGGIPRHTLRSKTKGPILLLDNGASILRIGAKKIEKWTVDGLPDHGIDGKGIVGNASYMDNEDTDDWEDDYDEVEPSSGTNADTKAALPKGFTMTPGVCARTPGTTASLLCSAAGKSVSCVQYDLGDGAVRISNRYLGHSGRIKSFSTSEGDDRSFLTAASDGIVRLFDVREPLPKASFDAGFRSEMCNSALYVHVQGVPFIFTGGTKSECIKLWDLRTKHVVYELSTGNNHVTSMAWDAPRSTLYAATESSYFDRGAGHMGYRRRKRVKRSTDKESERNDWEYDEPYYDDWGWPRNAHHDECNFGYTFDAGYSNLMRYEFGVDANPKVLPKDGMAERSRR